MQGRAHLGQGRGHVFEACGARDQAVGDGGSAQGPGQGSGGLEGRGLRWLQLVSCDQRESAREQRVLGGCCVPRHVVAAG